MERSDQFLPYFLSSFSYSKLLMQSEGKKSPFNGVMTKERERKTSYIHYIHFPLHKYHSLQQHVHSSNKKSCKAVIKMLSTKSIKIYFTYGSY